MQVADVKSGQHSITFSYVCPRRKDVLFSDWEVRGDPYQHITDGMFPMHNITNIYQTESFGEREVNKENVGCFGSPVCEI